MNRKFKGYLMGVIAAATYGMNPLFALPLYSDGLGASDVLLYRYIFAIVILSAMAKWRGQSLAVPLKTIPALAGLGLLMGLSSLLLFESYNFMAAGIASTILFVYPIMVALIMACVCHEKLKPLTGICLAMATCGIAFLYKGEEGATLSATGTMLVMASALSYAIYLVWVNRPSLKNIPTITLTLYVILFGSLIFIARQIADPTLKCPSSAMLWGCALALALLPTAISLICTTIAIQNIGSTATAILGALEPMTAIFFGITIFGETLTPRDIAGLALILIAVTLVIAGDNISSALLRMRKMFPRFYHRLLRH